MSEINLYNMDCMIAMRDMPDKAYDLAICDIPYGIGVDKMPFLKERNTSVKQKNGTRINPNKFKKKYHITNWDKEVPTQEYFDELKRVSEHQIIFGVGYVNWTGLGAGRIKWNKGFAEEVSFKGHEIAYCSMIDYTYELDLLWAGMQQAKSLNEPMTAQGNKKLNEKRTHPCYKPIMLYKKILIEFAKPGMKILDTHAGGFSIGIACYDMQLDLDAYEIDTNYHNESKLRFDRHVFNTIKFPH